ncbi:Lrp/AsnC family transcriptional regulator [Loktanella sp. SALINAS62]|uniref:Lrp/AsnC family transcriptional regulator n=1 Tax=Loktanella sp. SALINAS62 TaxID=2706124 RepID=UPI001B8CBC68|nr:Lrp/AsnC family transcriptional regulator [Loktanella sp. SALINAS62]MBS1302246.1 Lrp/AsnC family transcriptional regulator [Loktanella sp. SALINAS62]
MTQSTSHTLDSIDAAILRVLQKDASLSQRDVADRVGLSQNACWRRIARLKDAGIITGQTLRLDHGKIGLGLTVFVMLRTRDHSPDWLKTFRKTVLGIENIVDVFRIAGDYDYMLKIVAQDMNDFDGIYQRLIHGAALETVTSYIAMEAIADQRDLPV